MLDKTNIHTGSSESATCISVSLFDMLSSLSAALDLIDFELIDHHNRVCYIATKLAMHLRFSTEEISDIYMAAVMHDIGAIGLTDRLKLVDFEVENAHFHGELGALLLSRFEPFQRFAPLVRFHHMPWKYGEGKKSLGVNVPYGSHILHLADRIAVLLDRRKQVFSQTSEINERIRKESGGMFVPAFVDAFQELSQQEAFWLDLISPSLDRVLQNISCLPRTSLSLDQLTGLSKFFALIIDTRSRFTATHSSGVASSAQGLAKAVGMNADDCAKIKIAGYLHDLGKLAVPDAILQKPGKPTKEEWLIIKAHPYYTHRILERVKGLEDITFWASNHHEELQGGGYPFAMTADNLSLGARTMAVADIFTALAEDRPYREGMEKAQIEKVFQNMVRDGKLDSQVVDALFGNYKKINDERVEAQELELRGLSDFWEALRKQGN
ncbi:MAG: HD domain-containing protein [Nitrospinaceae bacterium]|nr:HD domain-containing protein [Nitrospina sp.]MBT5867457.1 HD domain-containing protein [Nitrospinaceae bacterium]MBT6346240.1 HD domain-containing protein [Nitrospina sp.]